MTAMKPRDAEAVSDPSRSIVDKWIRFKIDAIDRLGEVAGKAVAKKAAKAIVSKRLNPKEAEKFLKWLRQSLDIPYQPIVLFKPLPSQKTLPAGLRRGEPPRQDTPGKVLVPGTVTVVTGGKSGGLYARGQQRQLVARRLPEVKQKPTKTISEGDLGILEVPETSIYPVSEVVPTPDILLGNAETLIGPSADPTDLRIAMTARGNPEYPYIPVRNPAELEPLMRQNHPGGRGVPNPMPKTMDSIYPYTPSDSPLDNKEFVRMDNLGTLLPPRPVMKPWRTAKQKLFQPGDPVINKKTHAVGQIRAIKGEEVMVSYGQGKYERTPMQDLAIYYGTIAKLKKAEGKATTDLARLVGQGTIWRSPKVVRK